MLAPPDSRRLPSGSGSQLGSIPILSLTASRSRCLQPQYFSVVWTDRWPSRNWICSSSPPESWQSRAHDLLRSCEPSLETPNRFAYSFTTCQTTFSVISVPQTTPLRHPHLKILPWAISATVNQLSIVCFAHSGIGTVRMRPPFPTRLHPLRGSVAVLHAHRFLQLKSNLLKTRVIIYA
jgi:hypothetical protein